MLSLEPTMDYQSASNYIRQWFNEDHQDDVSEHFHLLSFVPSNGMFRMHNGHKINLLLNGSNNFKRHLPHPSITV